MIFALMLSLLFLTTGFASERKTAVFAMEKAGEQTHQVSVADGSRIAIMGKNSEEISKIPKLIVDGGYALSIDSMCVNTETNYYVELNNGARLHIRCK